MTFCKAIPMYETKELTDGMIETFLKWEKLFWWKCQKK